MQVGFTVGAAAVDIGCGNRLRALRMVFKRGPFLWRSLVSWADNSVDGELCNSLN